jgi:stearoyl-CoA desaturase (delta-9 desaturase)
MRRLLMREEHRLKELHRLKLAESIKASRALTIAYAMRRELAALCARSRTSCNDRLHRLQDWCRRAEASGIQPLIELSARLRSYG